MGSPKTKFETQYIIKNKESKNKFKNHIEKKEVTEVDKIEHLKHLLNIFKKIRIDRDTVNNLILTSYCIQFFKPEKIIFEYNPKAHFIFFFVVSFFK